MSGEKIDCSAPYTYLTNFKSERECLHCICGEKVDADEEYDENAVTDESGSDDVTDGADSLTAPDTTDERNDGTQTTDRKKSQICINEYLH